MEGVYVLGLEKGKIYVGWSGDIDKRIAQHFAGKGAQWTQHHKPVKVHFKLQGGTLQDETNITKCLLNIHGLDVVRGGPYTSVKADKLWIKKDYLSKEYEAPEPKYRVKDCYKCNEELHLFKTTNVFKMPDDERKAYLSDIHFHGGFVHYTWLQSRKRHEWVNYCPECGATNM